MKTLRKNLLLLAFAVGALMLIGGNVWGSDPNDKEAPGEEVPIITCPGGAKECVRISEGNTVHIFYKK